MTEEEPRSLLQKSKKEWHRAIFQQYGNYVYTIVYSKLRSCATHEDIEECVSDVFAEIFMHLDTDKEGSLQGYISIVAKRTAINAYHRLSRKSCMMISLDDENIPPVRTEEDRGFPSLQLMYHLLEQKRKFVMRVSSNFLKEVNEFRRSK